MSNTNPAADFSCTVCHEPFPAKLPERTDNWTAARFDKFFADRGWQASPVKCPGCIKKATAWASRPVAVHAAARVF